MSTPEFVVLALAALASVGALAWHRRALRRREAEARGGRGA